MEIIITVVSGVLVGVIVFIVGQILTSIWLNPLQQFKELKKDVVYKLIYYANLYTNVIDLAKYKENDKIVEEFRSGSDELRKLSCSLRGFAETLSWFRIGIPSKKILNEAAKLIMALSNSFFAPYNTGTDYKQGKVNHDMLNEIIELLKCYK